MSNDHVALFFETLNSTQQALPKRTFHYCTAILDGMEILLTGRLFIEGGVLPHSPDFQAGSLRAGQYDLDELGLTTERFVNQALSGSITLPHGVVFLTTAARPSAIFQPLHAAGDSFRNRLAVLTISGNRSWNEILDLRRVDWELKASETPYDNFHELLAQFRLSVVVVTTIEVIIQPAAQVDLECSVKANHAEIGIFLASGAVSEFASIGYRVIGSDTKVSARGRVSAKELTWNDDGTLLRGRYSMRVPAGSMIECFAKYKGVAQNYGFIVDPKNIQNDRRQAYEVFDPLLETLRDWVFRPVTKGIQARDFEAAVSWLLWIQGFDVANLGLFPKTQEGPDLLVTTPRGEYFVVECTMGMLRTDSKLANVVRRAKEVQQAVHNSGHKHLRVIPVMVTSLTRDQIAAELEDAERNGVYVVSREGLEDVINRSMLLPDANQAFDDVHREVTVGLAKFLDDGKTKP